ncbi:MAG TPA: hypothetical protein VKF42_00955 [Chitinivibrionales bacterium]|nr:hypothetical protein [Chitinivibrionales bacterium]
MTKTKLLSAVILMAVLSFLAQPWAADSLAVDPLHPTTADPITFTIIIPNWDCCTQYANDSTVTLWGDTGVLLTYTYNLPQVCPMIACLNVDKDLVYKSAPLKAGTYSVYELREILCTTGVCPDIAFAPVKIGAVTVLPSTGITNQLHRAPIAGAAGTAGHTGIYDIRGSLISSSGINAKVRAPGVYFVRIGSQATRTVIAP